MRTFEQRLNQGTVQLLSPTLARTLRPSLLAGAVASIVLMAIGTVDTASAKSVDGLRLGFTPITTNALSCAASGYAQFANDSQGRPVTPTPLMQALDPATPVNAPITSDFVGRENDMLAVSPNGKYLFTPSENGVSDGITRLTLKGPNAGKKEILANNVDPLTGANLWSRNDGIKWYPYGGPDGDGVLLVSEEFAAGGIWQINPDTGAFVRLDWLGNISHEGIGLDGAGNLYLGDENRAGAIYKAVPNNTNDLTQGGTLYYLVGTGIDASGWKAVSNPVNATSEAQAGGAILFDRPEDFDERFGRVYFAVTEPKGDADTRHGTYGTATGNAANNQVVNRGGVYSLNADGQAPSLSIQSGALPPYSKIAPMIEVQDPTYANIGQAQAQQGLQFPDNLAFDGQGHLWVHEDIPDGDGTFPASGIDVAKQARNQQDELYVFVLNEAGDAIVPNPDTSGPGASGGYKAADMRTSPGASGHPCENEFTGGIFAPDGRTLYINQQHWDNPTLTIKLY